MRRTEFSVNPHTGELVVRGADPALLTTLAAHLGRGVDLDCGECPPPVIGQGATATPETPGLIRVAGFLHQSMVDGPGLRSVVFFQGCARRCPGCRNRHTHSFDAGTYMTTNAVLDQLLRVDEPRDGVTISGGEPFSQVQVCAQLVACLKHIGVHVAVYTGYTYEQLARSTGPAVQRVLEQADILVEGRYIAALREERLAYRGSLNQRVIDLSATKSTGELRLFHTN